MEPPLPVLPTNYGISNEFYSKGCKRTKISCDCDSTVSAPNPQDETEKKKPKVSPNVVDYSDPFALTKMLEVLNTGGKYGSVTKDIEALFSRNSRLVSKVLALHPCLLNVTANVEKSLRKEASKVPSRQLAHLSRKNFIDLEDDSVGDGISSTASPVVVLDSDDEDNRNPRPLHPVQEIVLRKPSGILLSKDIKFGESNVFQLEEYMVNRIYREEKVTLTSEIDLKKDKGVYVGVEEDVDTQTEIEDDGLGDIWKEMSMALEFSKDAFEDPSSELMPEDDEDCDHSFVLKDDLGYVCRICGVIERGIETIIDIQHNKMKRSSHTYASEPRNAKNRELIETVGIKLSEDDLTVTDIAAHPRHMKQMKPHQVEGFNFLLSNLVTDNPGGCILAHAPGSGKTFMIISFMQSFLAKYPHAKPLVVLPKGILATWKKEFETWQVEDIPLLDFYTVKADNRPQQLEVLKQWVERKSILFLGYKQFSTIICDGGTGQTSVSCQEILLRAPSILILDEGHTPRNENTDVLQSLAKVQTTRKVVLSGTLYQNHVKEVFNILNLVRPKFLRLDTSRSVIKRIMSKVNISGVKKQFKAGGDAVFYDLVEHTLQKDENFERKVSVINDLREMTSKVLHYYKGDFLDELPGLVDFTVVLGLSPRQKDEVQKLKRFQRKFKISSVGSAVYLHPKLNSFSENYVTTDDKMDDLLDKLDVKEGVKAKFFLNLLNLCDSAGEKLLVFSQYLIPLKFLERLSMKMKGWHLGMEIFSITGESTADHREWSMERFNNSPDAKVFFGSIKACGEGISLVGASRIIILDVHLNPSVTRQAIGRAFRPGQTKKVYAYRLVAGDSPEEEDHSTCFKKELIAKMWFEWNKYCGNRDFDMETVNVNECNDPFLESLLLREDVRVLYKRCWDHGPRLTRAQKEDWAVSLLCTTGADFSLGSRSPGGFRTSDTYMKGHKKRKRILKEGEHCASSAFSGNPEKTKKEASRTVDSFDPFAIPNLFRALDTNMFGSVTEEIEALRALKLRRLNPGLKMKPTQSFNQLVSHQANETFSDQSVTQPEHNLTHLEDDYSGNDDKVTVPIIIIDSDDGIQRPSLQCHKAVQKGPTAELSINELMVRGNAEKDASKEEVRSAATKMDIGQNKSIDLCDFYAGVRCCVERKAPKEELSNRLQEIAFGMDGSVDQVTSCLERKASEEEVETVPNIDVRTAKYTYNETDDGMMTKEENDLIDITNDMGSKPSESVGQVTGCSLRKASEEVETVPNIDVRTAKYTYNETDDGMMIKEENDLIDITDDMGSKPSEIVGQVTSCLQRKASEEVEAVPNIDVRTAEYTYNETDDGMMIKEENDLIDITDDMGSKPSESVGQVTSCSQRKASEEVETVPNIDVRTAKYTYNETDDGMMNKEENDLIDITDDVGSKPSESVGQVTSCSRRKASEEEVETVPNIDVRSAKYISIGSDDDVIVKEENDQIDVADDMGSKPSENSIEMDKHVDHVERESSGEELESCPDITVMTDKSMYIGTNEDLAIEEDNNQAVTANDGLTDIWNEMAFALECSKDIAPVPIANEHSKEDEECDHSFVLKDDLGYVCRICGVIERGIESIFEFQYSKVKRTLRTYMSEPQNMSKSGLNGILSSGVNSLGQNLVPTEICVHPRHRMQMKPHQVDGFNFLCSNLLADDPGGCILAHAPGSGKTFMIISFIQSFLAKYPQGRPLVILPKGILSTWKKEFQTWQIEDIPLLDFYTSKAENRYQQLDVLLQWEKRKSILFLGYKQFSVIVCDSRSCKVAADCQDKLLKVPTVLILDEGHTPRNEDTDVLQSLAKVRTPRKVVLSGTLYQNHVKEVFNILNLVRPKFLKFNTSRAAVSRIMSKVQISGSRNHLKAGNDLAFFDLVEYTLQKDANFERKVAVIKDLREMTSNVLHYYKGDCLDELPGLIDYTVVLNLSAKQKEEVQKLKKSRKFSQISDGSALYVHPQLKYFSDQNPAAGDRNSSVINERIDQMLEEIDMRHGVKMKFFLNILGLCEATGEKLLVFSQFILPLKLLERLSMKSKGWIPGKEIFSIRGDSTSEQREWSMQRFNSSPDAKVFFGSIKACGEGISLVGASRIIILDVHLNPSVTRQAIGRAFRPGQKRKVYTYRLVAANSPEEENYLTCFRKEFISKMWFEWSESSEFRDFEVNTVDLDKCDDLFLQTPLLQEDIKVLYKR
ncbi:hypothetical protein REPUB_Repub01dG0215800 [Reevesia pubescens]